MTTHPDFEASPDLLTRLANLCPECGFALDPSTGRHVNVSSTTLDCERMYPAPTTDAIIAELQRCNPFGGYTKAQGRESLVRTLNRYKGTGR